MKLRRTAFLKSRGAVLCVVVLCASAALVVGCGGSGGSDPELTTSSLDKAVYVKKVNGICKAWLQHQFAEMKRVGTEPIAKSAPEKAMTKIWAPGLHEEAEKVRKTGAPAGDAPKIEAFLTALEQAAEEVEAHEPADLIQLQKYLEPVNRFAGGYGLEGCEF